MLSPIMINIVLITAIENNWRCSFCMTEIDINQGKCVIGPRVIEHVKGNISTFSVLNRTAYRYNTQLTDSPSDLYGDNYEMY